MASIYDFGDKPTPTLEVEEPKKKRTKNRETTLSPTEKRACQKKLVEMVEGAFNTLESAMKEADFSTAVKAAQIILDRSGFGPKSTVDVNTTSLDLSELTREELAERASRIADRLRMSQDLVAKDKAANKPVTIN